MFFYYSAQNIIRWNINIAKSLKGWKSKCRDIGVEIRWYTLQFASDEANDKDDIVEYVVSKSQLKYRKECQLKKTKHLPIETAVTNIK